jgi:GNAT superfamily N-acetyltransferase
MFVDTRTAARIERAEAHVIGAVATALTGSSSAPDAIAVSVGAGLAAFVRPGSPLNKLIGVGLDAPLDDAVIAEIERLFADRREPVRAELSTLAVPELGQQLTARGYRLHGFENVLARTLTGVDPPPAARVARVQVERVGPDHDLRWKSVVVDAALAADETGVPPDAYSREAVDVGIGDLLTAPGFLRYLASIDGVIAGGASMLVHDGVAVLTGSATLPSHRRQGVQAALIARRLHDARAAGAELAAITTAPGTQSQANVMKRGFALAYARAILVRG